jgi:hypothetical protein
MRIYFTQLGGIYYQISLDKAIFISSQSIWRIRQLGLAVLWKQIQLNCGWTIWDNGVSFGTPERTQRFLVGRRRTLRHLK